MEHYLISSIEYIIQYRFYLTNVDTIKSLFLADETGCGDNLGPVLQKPVSLALG
jgi:hypothetical protein